MQPYSMDLRERVLADIDAGMTQVATARKFTVSTRWIYNLLRRREETGEIGPKPRENVFRGKLAQHEDQLIELVDQQPDASLQEFRQQLEVPVGVTTVWRSMKRLGLRRKKGHSRC